MTKLIDAVLTGDIAQVQSVIESGCDVNENDGFALYKAINAGHLEITKLLMEKGAEMKGESSSMPLYAAAGNGWFDIVKALVANGADVNPSHSLPLIYAIRAKSPEIANYLIKEGASVNNPKVLIFAIKSKKVELAQILLENGADANAIEGGVAVIIIARSAGEKEMVKLLRQYGAKENVSDMVAG